MNLFTNMRLVLSLGCLFSKLYILRKISDYTMVVKIFWFLSAFFTLFWVPCTSIAQVDKAYADVILEAYYSHANPRYDYFYGGDGDMFPLIMDPRAVLGNNRKFVSLPKGSYIIVGFTDNTIIDAPHQDDLFIQEVGRAGDQAAVWVSANGKDYVYLGRAKDDKVTSFDLADIGFKKPVVAVKIMGIDTRGSSPGFDLVSVRAMKGAVGDKPSPRLVPKPKHIDPPPAPRPTKITKVTKRVNIIRKRKVVDREENLNKILKTSGLRSKLHTLKRKKNNPTPTKIISTPTRVTDIKKKNKKKKKVKEAGAEVKQY